MSETLIDRRAQTEASIIVVFGDAERATAGDRDAGRRLPNAAVERDIPRGGTRGAERARLRERIPALEPRWRAIAGGDLLQDAPRRLTGLGIDADERIVRWERRV